MKKFLLSLAAVAMTATLASAETVTFDFVNNTYGQERLSGTTSDYIDQGAVLENGAVTLTLTSSLGENSKNESGARFWSNGLRCYTGAQIAISVANGTITSASFTSTGDSSFKLDESTWTLSYTPTSSNKALTTLTVDYTTEPVGDKKLADLSFAKSEYNVPETQKFFSTATLSNPNGLAVTYTSSDTSVATVAADGTVSIVAGGTTTITATSEETDEFMEGKASYTLNVLPAVSSVEQMLALANNAKVLINTDLYVGFVNNNNVFVTDGDNWIQIYNANDYKTGDIIPYGWSATYTLYGGSTPELTNATLPAAKGTAPITYSTLDTVTASDVNKVAYVVATFADAVPSTKTNFTGKIGDTEYTFRNNYTIEGVEAGTYKVLCVVNVYQGTPQLYTVSYEEYVENQDPEFPESIGVTCDNSNITITQSYGGDSISVSATGEVDSTVDTANIILATPEGWDGFIFETDGNKVTSSASVVKRAPEYGWTPVSAMTGYGFKTGNVIVAESDNIQTQPTAYLVKGDNAAMTFSIDFKIKIKKGAPSGVEEIEAAEADAEYYTLDGVKVAQPAAGIYVKVCGEKVEKVVIK